MPAPSFVHLRLHSEYSIVDGIDRAREAIASGAAREKLDRFVSFTQRFAN